MKRNEAKRTVANEKSVQEVCKQTHGKADIAYWKSRLYHPSYTRGGKRNDVPALAVKIQHAGRRELFNLRTENAAAAAAKARDVYVRVVGAGWEAALAEFKPKPVVGVEVATVGEMIAAVVAVATVSPRSLSFYVAALRRIAADVAGIESPVLERVERRRADGRPGKPGKDAKVIIKQRKIDVSTAYRTPEFKAWRAKVDAVRLDKITPERVANWRARHIAEKTDPTERASAKISADSIIRSAKALFGKKILPHVARELKLPDPLPFAGVAVGGSAKRFRPEVSAQWLFAVARTELEGKQPEVWKALCLCLLGGLRRAEADTLQWSQLNLEEARIEIRRTEYFSPKSTESERDIELTPDAVEIMRRFRTGPGDDAVFVLKGGAARPDATFQFYRADAGKYDTWNKLGAWLDSKGIKSSKPIHALRKLAGSLIHEAFGIEAARDFLGHADIATTSASYLAKRPRVAVSLGSLTDLSEKQGVGGSHVPS